MNLHELSDVDLDTLRTDVAIEQERRKALATIPEQIRELTQSYVDCGGNAEDLHEPA